MRIYLIILVIAICFGDYSGLRSCGDSTTYQERDFIVDVYEDNKLVETLYYRDGKLSEGEQDSRHQENTNKAEKNDSHLGYAQRQMEDFYSACEYLESEEQIVLPIAKDLLLAEVADISLWLSEDPFQSGYRLRNEVKRNGHTRIISVTAINKSLSFPGSFPSYISILTSSDAILEDYELTITDNYPRKEIYKTTVGKLTREYIYEKDRIVMVTNKYIGSDVEKSFERRFEYIALGKKGKKHR